MTFQTVQDHCDACAQYAGAALAGIGLRHAGELCGKMHDGKMTRAYQKYLFDSASGVSVRRGSVNHTFAPVRYLLKRYHTDDAGGFQMLTAELIAYAVGAHHGLFDCMDERGQSGFEHRLRSENAQYEEHMGNFFRLYLSEAEIDALFHKAIEEVRRVIQRIPDRENNVEKNFAYGALARLLLSAVIEGDRRNTAAFMRGEETPPEPAVDWRACLRAVECFLNQIKSGPLSEPRRFISDACERKGMEPGKLFRLNVPTGAGKTLSALRFALAQCAYQGKKQIFFVMPLLAIIEQNAKEIRNALGNTVEVLEHHSNVVVPRRGADKRDGDGDEELDERELLCESWRAPVVCTTLVQFLDTLFSGRTSCIRRFQALCESVIVIDEMQSVPASMLSQFHLMINFLTEVCGAAVVLCSATQASGVAVPHPLLPAVDLVPYDPARFSAFRRTDILPPSGDPLTMAEIAEECGRQLAQVDTLMVGCNTRAEAAELFGMLRARGVPCVHLSAAMCMAHRLQALEQIEKRRPGEKLVCVATQVIEYGVNVSFQRVFRIMTGLDEVIQIAGRCNRHGEDSLNLGRVQILRLKGERLPGALHTIQQAQNATEAVLARYRKNPSCFDGRLDSDAAVRAYYQLFFSYFKVGGMDYPLKSPHKSSRESPQFAILNMLSDHFDGEREGDPPYFLHQAFKEAGEQFRVFSEDTMDLVVPFGEGVALLDALRAMDLKNRTLAAERIVRRLRPFSVSVYRRQLERLEDVGAVEVIQPEALGLRAVRSGFYDSSMGLVL